MLKLLKILGYALVGLVVLYLAAALILVFWPARGFEGAPRQTAAMQAASVELTEQRYAYRERRFRVRDGVEIFAREVGAPSDRTILIVHGVASDSTPFNVPAGLLHEASGARVVAIDLRGHGRSAGRRWSVDYAGQYEDDVADVIAALHKEAPRTKIILAGHSMGGGVVLRYGLKPGAPPVDAVLLIAPLLGGDAASGQAGASAGGAKAAAAFVQFRTPRLFGALMFNLVGVHAFDRAPIMVFNQPPAMPAYGFAALQSMQPNAPKDYKAALGAIHKPLLLVAGSKDEAFQAKAYPGIVARYGHGKAVIIDGATHNSVLRDPRAIAAISGWLAGI